MAYRFRLIFLLFLSFFSFNSFAVETFPASVYYCAGPQLHDTSCSVPNSSRFESLTPALDLLMSLCQSNSTVGQCTRHSNKISYIYSGSSYNRVPQSVYSCPSNAMVWGNATTCACKDGFNLKNGQCIDPNYVEPPDLCESLAEKCGTLSGSKKWIIDLRRDVSYKPFKTCTPAGLVPGCNKGCVINSSGNGVFYKDQSGDYYFEGEGTISSETCFPTSEGNGEPPKEEDNPLPPSEPSEKPCKSGEYEGTVSGTKVCLPAKSKETIIKEETINNNDNSTTNINTTVKCENGKCTISETTTNKDSSGATTGESTKETQVSQSDFCAQNPGSSVCKSPGLGKGEEEGEDDKKSSFSGSCGSSFNCEGDSVQCAIALEQHKTACKLFDESNTYFQAFKDAEASNSDGVESSTVDLASHVSVDSVIGSGACPADIEVTVFNQVIPFELSKFCRYFDAMGMLIVLGASVGCLRILGSG